MTTAERRVVCLVVAQPALHVELPADSLRSVAIRQAAQIDRIPDGSLVAVLSGADAATDLAARAARCALGLRAVVGAAPMALATGLSEAGERWRLDDFDARVQALLARAEGSGVALVAVTAGLLGADFDADGSGDDAAVARTLLGRPLPCLGRDREIASLTGLVDAAITKPVARAALVVAAAGVGKSRVREEVVRAARARWPVLEVWMGRGDPMIAGSPYGLVAQAVRRAARVLADEPLATRRASGTRDERAGPRAVLRTGPRKW